MVILNPQGKAILNDRGHVCRLVISIEISLQDIVLQFLYFITFLHDLSHRLYSTRTTDHIATEKNILKIISEKSKNQERLTRLSTSLVFPHKFSSTARRAQNCLL